MYIECKGCPYYVYLLAWIQNNDVVLNDHCHNCIIHMIAEQT